MDELEKLQKKHPQIMKLIEQQKINELANTLERMTEEKGKELEGEYKVLQRLKELLQRKEAFMNETLMAWYNSLTEEQKRQYKQKMGFVVKIDKHNEG